MLARLMERLERSARAVDADQYRTVVQRLAAELDTAPRDAAFDALLDAFPGVAELYENLNYRHAGLCRSPLERSLGAEMAAREAIEAARRQPRTA
jgi:hypothetical protein